MGSRTITGVIYHPGGNTPWVGTSVVFELMSLFQHGGRTFPAESHNTTTVAGGAFTITLAVPTDSSVIYRVYVGTLRFDVALTAGPEITLDELIALQDVASVMPDALQAAGDAFLASLDPLSSSRVYENQPLIYKGRKVALLSPYSPKNHNYKGQLHCHSTNSDGHETPTYVVTTYRDAGYDFISLTDHDKITADPGVSGILFVPGSENLGAGYHISRINAITPLDNTPGFQEVIDQGLLDGSFVFIPHPVPTWTELELEGMVEGYYGLEVWNSLVTPNNNGEARIDFLLSRNKKCYLLANDDEHSFGTLDTIDHAIYAPTASTRVFADSLTLGNIMESLKRGNFYASNGANILSVSVSRMIITVVTDEASTIDFVTNGGVVSQTSASAISASYTVFGDEVYVRARVTRDSDGLMAWTNPIYVEVDPGVDLSKGGFVHGNLYTSGDMTVNGSNLLVSDGLRSNRRVMMLYGPTAITDFARIETYKYGTGSGPKGLTINPAGGMVNIGGTAFTTYPLQITRTTVGAQTLLALANLNVETNSSADLAFSISSNASTMGKISLIRTDVPYTAGTDMTFSVFNAGLHESLRLTSAGYVGIGTTLPLVPLDVRSVLRGYPATSGTTNNAVCRFGYPDNTWPGTCLDIGYDASSNAPPVWLQVRNPTDFAINRPLLLNPNGGNVGINTLNPKAALSIGGGVAVGTTYAETAVADGNIIISGDARISGRIGVGTTSPSEQVEIASATGGRLIVSDGGGNERRSLLLNAATAASNFARIEVYKYGMDEGGKNLTINPAGGMVNIGGATFTYPLQITRTTAGTQTLLMLSNLNAETGSSAALAFNVTGSSVEMGKVSLIRMGAPAVDGCDLAFSVYNNGLVESVRLTSAGRMGIGTVGPKSRLDIDAGAMTLAEMTTPAAPAAGSVVLYAVTAGAGKTKLMARFPTGAAIPLATEV